MTQDQCIRNKNSSALSAHPKHCRKTRIASFNRSNITVTMKTVSKFNMDTGEYKESSPKIFFMTNGYCNKVIADPSLLRCLGSTLTALGDTVESVGILEELPTEGLIRNRIGKFISDSKTLSEMTS